MAGQDAFVVAVDVGSASARAGVFDGTGRMLARATASILINRPQADHAEHSSADIWSAVATVTRRALAEAGVTPASVRGLSFDATCSLAVFDAGGKPVTVSTSGDSSWNVVMWADHRATAEAEEITATGHRVLDYVGGVMSPEMEMPKLMWLKRHLPSAWQRYARAFDLADFLVWRASGRTVASECTVTCKWGYLAHEAEGWQADFLERIGLDDLPQRGGLVRRASPIGARAGTLTRQAADELGLTTSVEVGVGLIDAHAGGLALLGGQQVHDLDRHLAVIAGTSTCHMAASSQPRPIAGVWGPYFGAMLPGLWLNEGGQSATGALLDHVLSWLAEGRALGDAGHTRVQARIAELGAGPELDGALLVVPDFHGNRSPLADPHARGVIHGLTLDASFDSLVRLYHAAAVGVALGTRHIIDVMNAAGYRIDTLHLTGGHARTPYLVQLTADATGCAIVLPQQEDGVLLGTSMVAATAAGLYPSLQDAARTMGGAGRVVRPQSAARAAYDRRYRAFRLMLEQRAAVKAILGGAHQAV
ncbi:MAG: FGGY-family carbohydrate kinase [Alphaproteobacteria bacterium]|nr:FGGY-family carbohydrate kinase [Alphaproteobacteria bacterium]